MLIDIECRGVSSYEFGCRTACESAFYFCGVTLEGDFACRVAIKIFHFFAAEIGEDD